MQRTAHALTIGGMVEAFKHVLKTQSASRGVRTCAQETGKSHSCDTPDEGDKTAAKEALEALNFQHLYQHVVNKTATSSCPAVS